MRRAMHAAGMGSEEFHTRFWWEHRKEGDHLKDLGVNGSGMGREQDWYGTG